MAKISALLPLYNTKEKYLRECIESVLNQTFTDFELIIVDDGSTNNTEEVVKSYSDNRIRYYKNEKNTGITNVRNKLLKLAKGDYIAIIDHDDMSVPERFEKEYNFLEEHPDISLVSGWTRLFKNDVVNPEKDKIWKRKPFPKYMDFIRRCEILHPACMWRRADFEKYDLKYEEGYFGGQDYALFSKVVRYMKAANLQEVLLNYRLHENNASKNRYSMCTETERVQSEMIDFIASDEKEKKLIFDKFTHQKVDFIHKLFSIMNEHTYKVIRILGFEIRIKRKYR